MGIERELGINHGNGSGYPSDGSAPASLPATATSWESKPYNGYRTEVGVWHSFGQASCLGTCAEYQKWFDNIPDDLLPYDPDMYYHAKQADDCTYLVVSPGLPKRTVGPFTQKGADYEVTRDMFTTPFVHPNRYFEGAPPYFRASFLHQELFSVGIGQYYAWMYTAKPQTMKIDGYRLATVALNSPSFSDNNHYNSVFGEAEIGPDNWFSFKTFLYANAFRVYHLATMSSPGDDKSVHGKFKGVFDRNYMNASRIECDEAYDNQFFDMNILDGTVPRYFIKGKVLQGNTIAMNWGNLTLANATDSCLRFNQTDYVCGADLKNTKILCEEKDDILGTIGAGFLDSCMLLAGNYAVGEMIATRTNFTGCDLTASKLTINNVQAKNIVMTAGEVLISNAIVLKDCSINGTGKIAIRSSSVSNCSIALGPNTVIEYCDFKGQVITQSEAVMVSCAIETGSVTVEQGAQLDSCWMTTTGSTVVKAGVKLVGVDLALKSEWNINDGNPNAEIAYTPIDQDGAVSKYGIPTKQLDFSGCILLEDQYLSLTSSARAYFVLYTPEVYDYSRLKQYSDFPEEHLTNEAQRLYKAIQEKLPVEVVEELADLGVVVGCAECKWYWPLPLPYAHFSVIDPRADP